MIVKSIKIEKFRAFENVEFSLGKRITAISGRNATQKTTLLGLIGQPFTISKAHPMYGCKTIDNYNFRSQFREKFKISEEHDIIGEHKWQLELNEHIYAKGRFIIESIARKQAGKKTSLRFWNAESRSRGAGYIQLPVYFLSLSRLFPIGESGKTQEILFDLTDEELNYCVENYRTILSIQHVSNPSIGIQKGTSSRVFAGISDSTHDIFTNSAGEGNVTRIILAVLSFKRLKEKYKKEYQGGILLIDELDATLHGFSQTKLVEYLWNAAGEYNIQIIFTTHSPIILNCVHGFQSQERYDKGTNLPLFAYDTSIVYLRPKYDAAGNRTISIQNVTTSTELSSCFCDINLSINSKEGKLNVYCEDTLATTFLKHALELVLGVNLDQYMTFVDIDLSWSNYIQLVDKGVPEFKKNVIVLDGDVCQNPGYSKIKGGRSKKMIVEEAGNILFLPLVIERDIFAFLKNHEEFSKFQVYCSQKTIDYDICFNNWPLEASKYKTLDFKAWFSHMKQVLGGESPMLDFWCKQNRSEIEEFVYTFASTFNQCAKDVGVDLIPIPRCLVKK